VVHRLRVFSGHSRLFTSSSVVKIPLLHKLSTSFSHSTSDRTRRPRRSSGKHVIFRLRYVILLAYYVCIHTYIYIYIHTHTHTHIHIHTYRKRNRQRDSGLSVIRNLVIRIPGRSRQFWTNQSTPFPLLLLLLNSGT